MGLSDKELSTGFCGTERELTCCTCKVCPSDDILCDSEDLRAERRPCRTLGSCTGKAFHLCASSSAVASDSAA